VLPRKLEDFEPYLRWFTCTVFVMLVVWGLLSKVFP